MRELTRDDRAALGACLAAIQQGLGEITSHIRLSSSTRTLAVETYTIPAAGRIERSWAVPYRSVAVSHHGTLAHVTVCAGPPSDVPPTEGPGIAHVPAGRSACWNLAGYDLTIYGAAGDRVTLAVFTCEQPPAWG